jgi:hypothetical protein
MSVDLTFNQITKHEKMLLHFNGLLGLREFETREKEEKVAISSVWNIQVI